MSEQSKSYEYDPIQFYGKAGFNASGGLDYVEVLCNGRQPSIIAHPEPGESIGDVFERAFEGAKTLLLTLRYSYPEDVHTEPAASQPK